MSNKTKDLQQEIEETTNQINGMRAKKRALEKAKRQHEEDCRDELRRAIGAVVEGMFADGCTSVGIGRLAKFLRQHESELVGYATVDNLDPESALERCREWQAKSATK